ncbi:MAG: GNAT family N-acetyltransferase [Flavobacteriales bacterium]
MKNNWQIKSWEELTKKEFHDIIQLRETVFIVEQNCSYLDVDGKDEQSYHLFLYKQNQIVAYSRLIPKGISYDTGLSIGRVVVSPPFRRQQLAQNMMEIAIQHALELFKEDTIIISAQTYLLKFYTRLGFKPTGKEYLEDNLPHIKMVYKVL